MKALISPNESPVKYISSWNTSTTPVKPIYTNIANSCRIAQVEIDNKTFEVAEPLFWTVCADNVIADNFYYNILDSIIYPIVDAPIPVAEEQPMSSGTTTI